MNPANFPNNRARKQAEAKERQAAYDALSHRQRLQALDGRLGENVGATKQRLKIFDAIAREGLRVAEEASLPPIEKVPAEKVRRQKRDEKRGHRP